MDDLQKLSASGGNDLYGAGTYSFLSQDIATITLTGTAGTATVTVNGVAKVATFGTSLAITAANFVWDNVDVYGALGIILTNTGNTLVFTSNKVGLDLTAGIVNLVTDLAGTVVMTNTGGTEVVTYTLSATGTNKGLVTVNGVSRGFTWDTNVGTTSAAFVAANAAAYAAAGIILTGTTTLIFTAMPGITITDATVQTTTGDATAAIARTGTRLPHQVYAINVGAEAIITSYKYIDKNGVIRAGGAKFIGATLTDGFSVIVFEYPAVEIVIASGTLVLNFVK